MLIDGLQPGLHVTEGKLVRHVKGDYHSVRLLVEGVGDCLKALLACGIPDLHCDVLSIWRLESGRHVVKAYSSHVTLGELLL